MRHMCYTQLSWVSLWIGGVSLLEESDHAVVDLWSSGPVSGDLQIQSSGRRLQDGELIFREINSRWASMSCGCCFIHQTRPSLTHSYSLHSFFSVRFLHRSLFISSLISSSCIYGSRCGKRGTSQSKSLCRSWGLRGAMLFVMKQMTTRIWSEELQTAPADFLQGIFWVQESMLLFI